ncbi:XRE family transcriptional regulator [Fusobacteria bacterium ZRK30]|nr:XRE family transcriptional regulator [Fusobacteria bacterium ZRK30]
MSYEVNYENRMKLAKLLKDAREKKDLKVNQLSVKADINKSLISRIEKGQLLKINPFLIKKLASALKIDFKELYKIVGYLEEDDFGTSETTLKESSNLDIIEGEYIKVPIYNSVSAGIGAIPDPEPSDYLSLPLMMGKGSVGITVNGDSMETTINNGSVVLIKKDAEVGHNDIGVFLHNDEALVKRYKCIEGKCYLTSDNKEYPDREIREEDDFKVCGKVVWILNKA